MLARVDLQEVLLNYSEVPRRYQELIDSSSGSLLSFNTTPSREDVAEQTPDEIGINHLRADRIVHINDIKKLCVDYRLRFLNIHYYKADFPIEALDEIKNLERRHKLEIKNLFLVAPASFFRLKNADDPLLLAPLGQGYYYLVYRWGKDLHPLRKFIMWPVKNLKNFLLFLLLLSFIATWLTPMQIFIKSYNLTEFLILFVFMFKSLVGIALFYGVAKGKNFSDAIWNSKYFNA